MARSRMVVWVPSPPSPSDPPRCDRPSRQISDFSPIYPDHALRFTAIRASERFRGRVALPALSGPLPRSAITYSSARNARHDAPRGPIRPHGQSTKRPASTSRRALNSPVEPASNGGRVARGGPSHNPGSTVVLRRQASRASHGLLPCRVHDAAELHGRQTAPLVL
jgi:hypothetical protein